MNAHEGLAAIFLHWFWVAFFVLFGAYLMSRKRYLSAADASSCLCRSTATVSSQQVRAAAERRARAEGTPLAIGLWGGAISIAIGIVAVFGVVPNGLLYAVLCFAMAALIGSAYLRLRNSQPLRAAVLTPRSSASVIPAYWFIIAVIAALSTLAYVTIPEQTVPGIVVCCSSLASTFISWRLTQMPSLLSGSDVAAEQLVDDRLRFLRSASALVFSLVSTFVYCTQILHTNTQWQTVAYFYNWPTWIAFGIWMSWPERRRRTVSRA